jgi:prepilin-type N-terminal cleavage/methylation domain-containing protein
MEVNTKQRRGFSVIELLVVVFIVSVLATLSWESLANARKKTQVGNACESVAVLANKARSYALSGIKDADRVRVHCVANTCQIQNFNVISLSWINMIGDTYPLQAAKIDDFDIFYTIPYAIGSGNDVSRVITLISDASITKTLTTSNFKATCQ